MGGGAMRTAAKVATAGLRGIAIEHHPGSSAARRAASVRPMATTNDDVKLVTSKFEAGVQRPCLEIDDYVFSGGEEEMLVTPAEPMPKVVFGGSPTLQEAKVATSELASALEEAYLLPSDYVGCENSVSNSEVFEKKACVASDVGVAPALPAPAISAIRFLQKSPVAQNVVASIACDQNVWNAVLQNQELQKFVQSQKKCLEGPDMNLNMELVADSDVLKQSFPKNIDDSSSSAEPEPVDGFKNILKKIKSAVVDMMSSLSEYFQNFFGGKGTKGVFAKSDGTAKLSADSFMEASFMGLAVMAILVILLKRA
ncbi:hypothetical protein CDL12_14480 [Handroanthus impetiginosus]|uniref:Uncharacterized protein n=1 Tax=Handroanthus impetiginosus TaxID=429701 RepID=A0A2G9H5W9_9LAMI|nr:hypothetical protein CDL12_14480 [Handroanthus impetiginosus]